MAERPLIETHKSLKPGIYVGSRRVSSGKGMHAVRVPLGRHQFFILVPKDPSKFEGKLKDLGNGVQGLILGAYKRVNEQADEARLKYHRNEPKDIAAAKEFLTKPEQSYWETAISRGIAKGKSIDGTISRLMQRAKRFRQATRTEPVQYPGTVSTLLGIGRNSNTFVQTLADVTGLDVREDFPGYDSGSKLRFDPKMFGKESSMTSSKQLGYQAGYMSKEAGPYGDINIFPINKGLGKTYRPAPADDEQENFRQQVQRRRNETQTAKKKKTGLTDQAAGNVGSWRSQLKELTK